GDVAIGRHHDHDPARPSVHDGVVVLQRLEHLLRPLVRPAPRADVCHSAANGLGVLVALAAKWDHGTPFILAEHGIYLRETLLANGPDTMPAAARRLLLTFVRRLTQTGYEVADLITPGSDYNRRWERIEGISDERIRCIHNGIDPDAFCDAGDEPDEPVITWVGRINPLKDPKTLLRAFARIHHSVPEARLRIYGTAAQGDEDYARECRQLLDDLDLRGSASFEGRIPDAADAYRQGQVVMLTSISEGFPFALIEAMSCGRPTVATDVGGVSEAVVDPSLLAPPRDDEQLAANCLRLLADRSLRRSFGAAGRRKVVASFTLDACLQAHRSCYRELAGHQGDRAA
ncbi:MAG TPA: GT4 family glycosyltransferase PelF, partial [Acidimicrobiales bacterium]|nr:GT4 family glycosyltransferase PelF [Acidimicrobiales bacterium]